MKLKKKNPNDYLCSSIVVNKMIKKTTEEKKHGIKVNNNLLFY